ncbi:MAG: tetratricopeptide repeat protein, partial [Bacteroidota bacterium]
MRKFLCILIFVGLSVSSLFAQSNLLASANDAYDRFHYREAIDLYEQLLKQDPQNEEAEEKLAHAYRKINDSQNAERWYAQLVQNPNTPSQNKLYYAQSLAKNGKYKESRLWYKAFARESRSDERGQDFVKSYQDTSHFHDNAHKYEVKIANFNSPEADFSPAYYREGIVFCSSRSYKKSPFKLKFNWNNSNYLDIFHIKGLYGQPEYFNKQINSKYHEGPLVFYNGDRSVIFTRNNYYKGKFRKSSEGINKLKLYLADIKNGEWADIREFPFNDDEYSVGHPTLSTDGNTLYFVSDMPGSLGGTDIFKSNYQNGRWSLPENLGEAINTPGNEMFPFIDANDNLYFASDGHAGLGGLDLFYAKEAKGSYQQPENLGVPINSSQDDFGLIINLDRNKGYFSSNREGGLGDDDIYRFQVETCRRLFAIIDSNRQVFVKDAQILISDQISEKEGFYHQENDSIYSIDETWNSHWRIEVAKEGYAPQTYDLKEGDWLVCANAQEVDTIKIYLNPPALIAKGGDPKKNPPFPGRGRPPYLTGGGDLPFDTTQVFELKYIYYDLDRYYIRPEALHSGYWQHRA